MEAHFTITEMMTRELGLKGSELLVYAVINGYSQKEQGCFYGSHSWLAWLLNMHPDTVNCTLKNLVKKGLITKRDIILDGTRRCEYTTRKIRVPENSEYPENSAEAPGKSGYTNIKDNKDITPNPKARTREELQAEFRTECEFYIPQYGPAMIEAFIDYWGAPLQNTKTPKLLWQDQRTWDLAARLRTWARKDKEYAARTGGGYGRTYGPHVNERGETATVASMRAARESFQRIADRHAVESQIAEEGEDYDNL